MKLRRVRAVYFSPCGTVERMTCAVAEGIGERLGCPVETESCTLPGDRTAEWRFESGELAVVGVPTYAGKTPNKLLPWLQTALRGGKALAIPLVLFGNRSCDNALAELCTVLKTDGFQPIAAAAFVSRHVFSNTLAAGRPNNTDMEEANRFARAAAEKIQALTAAPASLEVPGEADAPYYVPCGLDGTPVNFLRAKPKTDPVHCDRCGLCVRGCPMGAIDPQDVTQVPGTCIKCQACVRRCPKHAKYFDDPAFLSHAAYLEQHFQEPKRNEFFL